MLDPAFVPGTSTPEPGGITSTELLRAVHHIVSSVSLMTMDVVEISPPYDAPHAVTAEVAHRVILEAICTLAWRQSPAIIRRTSSPLYFALMSSLKIIAKCGLLSWGKKPL